MSTVCRPATSADESAVTEVMSRAFDRKTGSEKYTRDVSRFRAHPESHLLLEVDGTIISALHISSHRIQIGSCIITKADVGEVSTHPDYQGRGFGSRLMEEAVDWMRKQGFHLSRLGGYAKFYQRFGWISFPRGFIEFPLAGLTSRGTHTDPDSFLSETDCPGQIRPYNPNTDYRPRHRLCGKFNFNRTGAVPQGRLSVPSPNPNWTPNPWHLVYEESGEVVAYLSAQTAPTDHTRFETRVRLGDAGVSPPSPEPLGYLLRHTLRAAHHYGATIVSARLPLDPDLYPIYHRHSLGFIPVLWQTTESGNMLQVIDFPGLIATLIPELQTRLSEATLPIPDGGLRLRVNDQTADLSVRNGQLTQQPGDFPEVVLRQDLFCLLLFGLQPFFHVRRQIDASLPKASLVLLDVLFPPQPTATGIWG